MTETQRQGDIGLLDKAKVQTDPEEPFAIRFNLKPSISTHTRAVFRHHRKQYHLLMQNLVMQQVVQQRMRNGIGPGCQKYRRTLYPMRGLRADATDKQW
ncbi:hypothetical protein D9M71_299290 [compost metagenome]